MGNNSFIMGVHIPILYQFNVIKSCISFTTQGILCVVCIQCVVYIYIN